MQDLMDRITEWLALYGLRVVGAVAILLIGWLLAKLIRRVVNRLLIRAKMAEAAASFITSLAFVGMMAFVIIAAIGKLGVQTASFVAVLAAAGLAIGLALQGSLANFAAGFLLVVFHPFKVGDYIEGAGAAGTVEQMEIFTTTLRSPDNKQIIVPNAKLTGDNIINYSAKEIRRIDMVCGISYHDNVDKAQQVLMDILRSDSRVLSDPEPVVVVSELADSSVNFNVRPWVKTTDYWDVLFDLTRQVKLRFDAEGISIPFPQQDVHIYKEEAVG
ncbi:MAG: mechanosensitive ion channel family protein [Phycisphaerae bacterium]